MRKLHALISVTAIGTTLLLTGGAALANPGTNEPPKPAGTSAGPHDQMTVSDFGPDTCLNGWVWREARASDHVCVTTATRSQTAYDNSQAAARRSPIGGPYGPDTCLSGWVWRDAFPGDHVCVSPATRSQAAADNAQANNRRASLNIWYAHWTVPPQCDGNICTIRSTDNIPRFHIGGDHFNFGSVYVGIFRAADGSVIWSTTLASGSFPGFVAGAWGAKATVFDCAAIGAPVTNNSYLRAYDYVSQRWSAPIYVTTGCAVL